jgi:hypothetical protein
MAGSKYNQAGSAEYLCLHKQPQFLRITPGVQDVRSYIYGTEYRDNHTPAFSNMRYHDAPCAVCYTSTRATKIAIPGRTSCPPSWTREYYGYLMTSGRYADQKTLLPVSMDVNSESVPGSANYHGDSVLFFIETRCEGIPCPPYSDGAELTCVVCTKWQIFVVAVQELLYSLPLINL